MKHRILILLLLAVALLPIGTCWGEELQDSVDWTTLYQQGVRYREQGNSHRALAYLQQAEALHSSDTVRRELAQCLFQRGQYSRCLALCEALLQPDSLDRDLYLMARCYEKMDNKAEAFRMQCLVAERNIENCNNLLSLCQTLISGEMYDDALALLDRYCAVDSTNASVNEVKAFALHKANRMDEAIALYEQLVADGDDRATTLYYLGLSYYRRHHVPEAYDLMKRAVERDGRNNSSILSRFGVVELAIKRDVITWVNNHRPCVDSLSILCEFDMDCPDHEGEYRRIDSICSALNRQGIADIQEAIDKMQPDPEILYYLYVSIGNHFFWLSDDRQAIRYYRQSLEASPSHASTYYNMAYCYHQLKDYRQEMACFEKFVELAGPDEDKQALENAKEGIAECRKVLFMKNEK